MSAVVLAASGAACYKPNIQDGGLLCADGGVCPDGFHCAGDGTCREGAPMVCQMSSPHVDPICSAQPGNDCDPVCQSRCECGRCNLVGSALACTPPGSKLRGDLCNAGNDDCAPGNVCLKDCGDKIARCYRFCANGSDTNASVCGSEACDIVVNDVSGAATNLSVCEPPAKTCNPVGDSGDCGDAALGCYITSVGETVCDCKGTTTSGGACGPYNSCIPGYRCVSPGGGAAATCFKTCTIGGSDCAAPTVCKSAPGSANYGYCDTP